jgi:transposase
VDETASKRGQNYITTFVDLETSTLLLFATEGRSAATLAAFRDDLRLHSAGPDQIEEFCIDMSAAFRKGIAEAFPEAKITFDKFHIMKLIGEAVDAVRREEQKQRPELTGSH